MKKHWWSDGFPVYEQVSGCQCRGCGATVMTGETFPTDGELEHVRLPLDCDEAVPVVLHEEYLACDGEDYWEPEDGQRPHVWSSPDPNIPK